MRGHQDELGNLKDALAFSDWRQVFCKRLSLAFNSSLIRRISWSSSHGIQTQLATGPCPSDFRTDEVISSGDSTRVLEQTRSGSSEDKAANMRHVCHAPGPHVCHSTGVKELSEKPKTN